MTTRHDPAALAAEWAEHADLNLREARHSRTQSQTRADGLDSEEEARQAERWKRRAEQSTATAKESRLMALMWASVATAQAPIDALTAEHDRRQRTEIELEHWQRVIVPEIRAERDACVAAKSAITTDQADMSSPEDPHTEGLIPFKIHLRSTPEILRFHANVLAQISRGAATSEAFTSITAARVGLSVLADQLSADLEPTAVDANNPCPCGCIDPTCQGCQKPEHQQLYAKD